MTLHRIADPSVVMIDTIRESKGDYARFFDELDKVRKKIHNHVFIDMDDNIYRGKLIRKVDLTEVIEDYDAECITRRKAKIVFYWTFEHVKIKGK